MAWVMPAMPPNSVCHAGGEHDRLAAPVVAVVPANTMLVRSAGGRGPRVRARADRRAGCCLAREGGLVDPQLVLVDRVGHRRRCGRRRRSAGRRPGPGPRQPTRLLDTVTEHPRLPREEPRSAATACSARCSCQKLKAPLSRLTSHTAIPSCGRPATKASSATDPQEDGHEVGELREQSWHDRRARDLLDHVGSMIGPPHAGLVAGEPERRGLDERVDVRSPHRPDVVTCRWRGGRHGHGRRGSHVPSR